MRWIIPLAVLLSGCAITISPISTEKKPVPKHHGKSSKHHKKSEVKPNQTPAPAEQGKVPDKPPYPPPNWDDIVRRTHPTPTISPYDFQ
jgi:hypothetical protein